jgi:hypothetical protein
MKRRTVLGGLATAPTLLVSVSAAEAASYAETRMRSRYTPLSPDLARQLSAVPVSGGIYHPCSVVLNDGTVKDRVYVVEATPWFSYWGVWPEDDLGKHSIDIRTVTEINNSPSRLPARYADELYKAGESGMGYTIFTVRFADGSSIAVGTGNAVDFIDYPEGQSPETVVGVLPNVGRNDPHLRSGPEYSWCLFETEARKG